MEWFIGLNPVFQGLLATIFTWTVTACGALLVCFFKEINRKLLDGMLGFGAGVMIAASFWSLLGPAIDLCEELGYNSWFITGSGFILGGLFVIIADRFLDKLTENGNYQRLKNKSFKRSILLVAAITLHNIPEGMAVGVAFGGAAAGIPGATVIAAILLAVGIGLQNFPEGAAVSLPLRREGYSRAKSFFYGQLSGIVEPVAGVLGVIAAITMRSMLPFLLSFSAGAMISVVSSELIPESAKANKNLAALGVTVGFAVMMLLDVALG